MDSFKLLELFKGTGSIGKVAEKLLKKGNTPPTIVSLDFEEKYKPDIQVDILKWNYKKFYEDTGFIPDFIWASPPCNTYSILAYKLKERDTKTAEPLSERAKQGTKILYRTLRIINFFKKLNPKLLFIIENPKGMMRLDKRMKKLPFRETTFYCLYGDNRRKPTDFWSNFPLKLKQLDDNEKCKYTPITKLKCIEMRYYIPPLLVADMLEQMKKAYIQN